MRGLAVVALLLGGLPIVTFVATLALSDGAPLQSFRVLSAGPGMPVAVHVTPDREHGQPVSESLAGIPTPAVSAEVPPFAQRWQPPDAFRLARHRTDAAWDRLDRQAAAGNRDALVFRTLMQSADFIRPVPPRTP
jgi:hypothetical protein